MGTFCNFTSTVTPDITNTPTRVFGSAFGCVIDSIVLVNTSDQTISVDLSLLRQEESGSVSVPLLQKLSLAQNQSVDWMAGKNGIRTTPQDMIFASSDYSDATFSAIVSFVEYKEIALPSPTPAGLS